MGWLLSVAAVREQWVSATNVKNYMRRYLPVRSLSNACTEVESSTVVVC